MPAAALPSDLSASHDLLHALLAVSLPGIILFRPVYASDDLATVLDLAYVHLNPAAQQMLRLPAQPPDTFLTRYPNAVETGIFDFYRNAFLSGESGEYAVNYSYDGLDNFFQLTAQRSGELLVVGFTDTAAPDRSAVERALRESQAAEQAARAEAERQRQRFYDVLMQLPAQVATYHGPEHVYQFVNARYSQFVSQHELLGRTVREAGEGAVPDEVFAMLDRVYATGEPVQLREVAVVLDRYQTGPAAPLFIDAFYVPLRDAAGGIYGVLDFSYDVTEQVLARRQVQQLNQEAQAAQAAAEAQRLRFYDVLLHLPAQVAAYHGSDHVYEFVNPRYQQYFAAQTLLGRSIREVIPGVGEQGIFALMDRVYQTGESFANPEVEAWVDFAGTGHPKQVFLNLSFHALRDPQGRIDGLLDFSYDVTEQVLARRQVEQLNQELETRVAERTREVERQRGELRRLFEQVPLAIAVLRGPAFVVEQANEYAAAVWGRPVAEVLGRPHFEALPEAAGQGYEELLTGVRHSGQPLVLHEVVVELARAHTDRPDTGYYNIVFKGPTQETENIAR